MSAPRHRPSRHRPRYAWHLARRFAGSLSWREVSPADGEEARTLLTDGEFALWRSLRRADQRHSVRVLRRFDELAPGAPPSSRAGVLLHDVGKVASDLGLAHRVAATLLGRVTERYGRYHDHVELGARLLREVGSDSAVVDTVLGRGPHADALRRADDGE